MSLTELQRNSLAAKIDNAIELAFVRVAHEEGQASMPEFVLAVSKSLKGRSADRVHFQTAVNCKKSKDIFDIIKGAKEIRRVQKPSNFPNYQRVKWGIDCDLTWLMKCYASESYDVVSKRTDVLEALGCQEVKKSMLGHFREGLLEQSSVDPVRAVHDLIKKEKQDSLNL